MLKEYSPEGAEEIRSAEDKADHYEDILGTYLVKLGSHQIGDNEGTQVTKLLHIISDYERIADHGVNMVYAADQLQKQDLEVSESALKDLDILVAFSGAIKDVDATGEEVEYTEERLNKRADGTHIKENQLKEEFHKDEYAMLIVAEKYQTGFDEPLLHTMFVDKKLKGVKNIVLGVSIGWIIEYLGGTIYYSEVAGVTMWAALMVCVLPFILGDICKSVAVVFICKKIIFI